MNSISHNPFRVLGVFANDPLKVRTANISRIRAFNKVGKDCEFDSDFKDIFGPVDRTEQSIEQAISRLSSDADTEYYSCLWIHKTPQLELNAKAPIDIIQSGIGSKHKEDIINVLVGSLMADNTKLAAEYVIRLFECNDAPNDEIKEKIVISLEEAYIEEHDWSLFVWWGLLKNYCIRGYDENCISERIERAKRNLQNAQSAYDDAPIGVIEERAEKELKIAQQKYDTLLSEFESIDGYSEHKETISFIAKVFNKESMIYLRRITVTVGKSDGFIGIWASHKLAKSVINVIKETCNLQTKEPHAEAQIVLSEYATAVLAACKKYYKETRFWDAKPVESLLEVLREIYRISYSSKTKEECTEFGKRVKNEMQFLAPIEAKSFSAAIRKEVESYCAKPNETRWALQLLKNCIAPLVEIKSTLGVDNLYYRRISTQIADDAIFASTSEIDSAIRKYNNPDNEKSAAKDNLRKVLLQAEQLLVNIEEMDLEREFIERRLNRFNEKINNCSKRYGISIENIAPTISLETEDDTYKQCNDYYSLVEYVQSHSDSPHIQEAIQRIWKIEDVGFPQMGGSLPAYRKALLAYKEKYPNNHNEQKLLKEIDEVLLGRTVIGDVSDYKTMLRLWPNHPKRAIIQGRLELATFRLCHDVVGWEDYLKEYPNGQYREDAIRLIKKAEEDVENDAFNRCVSIASLNRFIFKYPKSPLADKAISKIEDMVYSQAVKTGNYDTYFKQYPVGRYTDKINQMIDDQCFKQCATKKDFKRYLSQYPNGQHKKQARAFVQKGNRSKYIVLSIIVVLIVIAIDISVIINKSQTFTSTHKNSYVENKNVSSENMTDYSTDDIATSTTDYSGNYNDDRAPSTRTSTKYDPDAEYRNNSLETGDKPYRDYFGRERTGQNYFYFKTSGRSDYVVIVKRHYDDAYINHIYIQGGDNAYLYVPDGTFDVYFYSGEGWNPYKEVGQFTGGFVMGTMQKDGPVELESAYMEYTLYPVAHGNLRLENENVNNVLR